MVENREGSAKGNNRIGCFLKFLSLNALRVEGSECTQLHILPNHIVYVRVLYFHILYVWVSLGQTEHRHRDREEGTEQLILFSSCNTKHARCTVTSERIVPNKPFSGVCLWDVHRWILRDCCSFRSPTPYFPPLPRQLISTSRKRLCQRTIQR